MRVKDNHAHLHQDLQDWFAYADEIGFTSLNAAFAESINKDHGRLEIRRCWAISDPLAFDYIRQYDGWADLHMIVRVVRERRFPDGTQINQTAFYISSLPHDAKRLLAVTRHHWAIENSCHWVLDVTFAEDAKLNFTNNIVIFQIRANELLIRFALLTPELNYEERPALKAFQPPPVELAEGLRRLHDKLPQPQMTEMGLAAPDSLKLNVQCWEACQAYSQMLREMCNPHRDIELDERLKGVYGRMHVQAFKLAALLAALDWLDTEEAVPTVTDQHWISGKAIAEMWRGSAARLLHQMDRSGEAQHEHLLQQRILEMFRRAGQQGEKLFVVYKNLHVPARQARHATEEQVRAGILIPLRLGQAEGYLHKDFVEDPSH